MQITKKNIEQIIEERGCLRFSTLMVRFHISSTEAMEIVEKYNKTGKIPRIHKKITASYSDISKKEKFFLNKKCVPQKSKIERPIDTESLSVKPIVSKRCTKNKIEGQLNLWDI